MTQGAARGRRLDIQGLRGLPVIPTLIYHMTSTPVLTGGVIFLDMFFTVSGFLITSRLLHLARTRTIGGYYWEFYKFRVRRLFPAAIFTILVTAALAYALFVPTRASHVLEDAYSSLFFFANIHFAAQGTDYMHRGISTSPLLPFWSLSVEEQFYVVWPIVILVVLAWAARRERQLRALVGACLAILVFALTYGWWFSATHHVAAYYDTLSRSGDFAIGALLAVYAGRSTLVPAAQAPRRPGRPRVLAVKARDLANRHAPLLGWSGIAVFAVGTFTTPTSHNFPVPWGLLGALGAGLVIYAGIDQPQRNRLLDNRVLVWLGDVSSTGYAA